MSIKNIINKKDNGATTRIAIVGTILSPLAIPALKAIETQIILHSPSVVAFGTGTAIVSSISAVALPVAVGVSAVAGIGILAKTLVKGEEKE
ncbi:MAG: hypothetical protein ACRDDY_08365 [Clostridium sp.]|uniref:hypothetical protein n=1 Tax=Clostridium sp. TaxID=1506 RepID=UPI003EE67FF2